MKFKEHLKEENIEVTQEKYNTYRNTYNEMSKFNKKFEQFVMNMKRNKILPEEYERLFEMVSGIINGRGYSKTTLNLPPFKFPHLKTLKVKKDEDEEALWGMLGKD